MALDQSVSRRRLLQLMGGAAAVGTLAACGGNGGGSSSSGGQVKVIGAGSQEAGLRKALDDYKKAHSDFDFNLSFSPTDQVQTALRTQLAAGNAPDLHVVYPGSGSAMSMVELSKAELLADLSDQAWTQKIPTGFKGAYQQRRQDLHLYSPGHQRASARSTTRRRSPAPGSSRRRPGRELLVGLRQAEEARASSRSRSARRPPGSPS